MALVPPALVVAVPSSVAEVVAAPPAPVIELTVLVLVIEPLVAPSVLAPAAAPPTPELTLAVLLPVVLLVLPVSVLAELGVPVLAVCVLGLPAVAASGEAGGLSPQAEASTDKPAANTDER